MDQRTLMQDEMFARPPSGAERALFFDELLAQHSVSALQLALQRADLTLQGELHAVALASLPRSLEALQTRAAWFETQCAPAVFCLLHGSTAVLLVSGDETAALMARMSAGARQLRTQLQALDCEAPVGVGGCHPGLEGLLLSCREARHARGYAFSTGDTILFDPELRRAAGTLRTDDCPTAEAIDSALQSGSESRAIALTAALFSCMRHKRVHVDECSRVLGQLYTRILARLSPEERQRAPHVLLPEQDASLEEVQVSFERLEGYLLQTQAQLNDTPAARCGRMATEYLAAHYMNSDLKLPELLQHLGVSRSYFSTAFKQKTGQSFVEYLTALRMEKAKAYLRETGLCTYEIAERVGFADPHYFSLTFRRRTGMTPKQYREAEAGTV